MVAPLIAAAAIGAGASLLGGMQQNSAARRAADKQMKFQKETLQHQYQWGMEDMRKAGLNPMLAYKQGGAGSASGSSYTPQNLGSAATQGASTASASAQAALRQKTELDQIRAQTGLTNEQAKTQTALQLQSRMAAAESAARTGKTSQETALLGYQTNSAKAQAAQGASDLKFNSSEIGRYLRWLQRGKQVINPFNPSK